MIKENIRKIAVTGVHKTDMVMYCAYVLRKMEYRVLISDGTRNREMEHCIRKPDKPMEMVRYKDIDFAFSELVSLDEEYDYIFYVQDFEEFPVKQADKRIYISDGERVGTDAFIRAMSRISWNDRFRVADCMLVYRDMYASYGMDYVEERIGRKLKGMFIHSIQHDCMDEACYQRMQFRPFSHMAEISAEMELAIRRMLQFATDMEEKAVKRGIKLAKRGRVC